MKVDAIGAVVEQRVHEPQVAAAKAVRLCESIRVRAAESLPRVLAAGTLRPR